MRKKPPIIKLVIAAALLSSNLFLCNFGQAAGETSYSKIGWWEIVYKELDDSNSCYAFARFNGETVLQLSLLQSNYSKQWVVFINNPQWNVWVGKKQQHILRFVAAKRFQGTFSVTENNSLFLPVSIEFVNSLADAQTLTIMSANNYVLAHLNMKDSEAAIRAVVNCVREHPFAPAVAGPPPTTRTTSSSGTAFFVAPNLLVTNNHVVKQCRNDIQVRYPDRAWYPATMSGQDETNDLALLHTNMGSLSVASFRLKSRVGESVAVFGFPYAGLLSSRGNFTIGTIAALSGMNDDSRFIQISAQVQPGNSGGPLLDMSGSVIGVVASRLDAIKMMQVGGNVPQDINFAIQAPIVVNFLSAKGETPKSDSSAAHQDLPSADVADLAQKITVQVYCGGTSTETSEASPPPPKSPGLPAPTNPTTALEQEAKQFVLSLQARWSRSNTEALAGLDALYEDQVMYYGKMTKKDVVIREKQAFVRKFPIREYKAREPIFVQCQKGVCMASGLVDFRAVDPVAKILSEGVASFEYQLIVWGDTMKINLENGEVKSRTRTPLPSGANKLPAPDSANLTGAHYEQSCEISHSC